MVAAVAVSCDVGAHVPINTTQLRVYMRRVLCADAVGDVSVRG